jgi:hypothetical protein
MLDDTYVCTRCFTLDEDAIIEELKRLREERAQFDAWAEQLRYERRLLGSARMTLDRICDPENTHQSDLEIRLLREEAGRTAQRIVDEIGHPVTDEPALGPEFRERIAELEPVVEAAKAWRALFTRQATNEEWCAVVDPLVAAVDGLSTSERDGREATCGAYHRPDENMKGFYTCSLDAGHIGDHAAAKNTVVWPRKDTDLVVPEGAQARKATT